MTNITIANALKELKHIDKRISKQTAEIQNISVGQSNHIPKFGDDQESRVTRLVQSTKDLIRRKLDLKIAIAHKNIETNVSFRGKVYSLQEILFMRESGNFQHANIADLTRNLFKALHADDNAEYAVKVLNDKLVDKGVNKIEVIRYFDIDQRDKEEKEFTLLLQELDYLIEQANFQTEINMCQYVESE